MQDRLREARPAREGRVRMERVAIARQPVQQRLVAPRRADDLPVRFPGRHRPLLRRPPRPAEAAATADEAGRLRGDQRFPGRFVGRRRAGDRQRAAALVVDPDDLRADQDRARYRERPVEPEGLLRVHRGGRIVASGSQAGHGGGHDRGVRRQRPGGEAGRVLGRETQLGARIGLPGADAERVADRVVGCPRPADRFAVDAKHAEVRDEHRAGRGHVRPRGRRAAGPGGPLGR